MSILQAVPKYHWYQCLTVGGHVCTTAENRRKSGVFVGSSGVKTRIFHENSVITMDADALGNPTNGPSMSVFQTYVTKWIKLIAIVQPLQRNSRHNFRLISRHIPLDKHDIVKMRQVWKYSRVVCIYIYIYEILSKTYKSTIIGTVHILINTHNIHPIYFGFGLSSVSSSSVSFSISDNAVLCASSCNPPLL